jgi:hypothetical protein
MITAEDIAKSDTMKLRYLNWVNNPDTQDFLLLVEREGRMARPHPDYCKGEIMLFAGGENFGWHNAINRLRTLDRAPVSAIDEIAATYGAEKILDELQGKKEMKGA